MVTADRFSLKLAAKNRLSDDITAFEFTAKDGGALPAYAAGAHIEIDVRPGLIRRYSLCGNPAERARYRIAVRREPQSRGGSAALHDVASVGDDMIISQPRNNFPLVPTNDQEHVQLFAGGIGITPILSMAYELNAQGKQFTLHYCTRSEKQTAFLEEIQQSPFAAAVRIYFDDNAEHRFDATASLQPAIERGRIYICGPDGFIRHIVQTARSIGVSDDRIHREAFLPMSEQSSASQAFVLKLAKSGQEFSVLPGKSIVETLEEANVFMPTTCRQGICGMCITNVLLGEPDHRDAFLTEQEKKQNDCMTPCCSRSLSPVLVLDI